MLHLHKAYIGLGSNLNNPVDQITVAVKTLSELPDIKVTAVSSFYQSVPLDHSNQPDYINAVAAVTTALTPQNLLKQLQKIELRQGRVRTGIWGSPRTLDLDLLLFDNLFLETDTLLLPHPGIMQRNFVLYPLYEIAPELVLPQGIALNDVIKAANQDGLRRLE